MDIFRTDTDKMMYLKLLKTYAVNNCVQIWSWCLMTNHVHFVMVPENETGLARTVGETHRIYTLRINQREHVRGHLFQERFHSFPIERSHHLLSVIRYIEHNPVRAGLVKKAGDYRWSSAAHRIQGTPDILVVEDSVPVEVNGDWKNFLAEKNESYEVNSIRKLIQTGRPFGQKTWIEKMEKETGRKLIARKVGRPVIDKK